MFLSPRFKVVRTSKSATFELAGRDDQLRVDRGSMGARAAFPTSIPRTAVLHASRDPATDTGLIQLMSDVHLEFNRALETLPSVPRTAPILALLGDIGYPTGPDSPDFHKFIAQMSSQYDAVLLVAGNHEYYTSSIGATDAALDAVATKHANVHVMRRTTLRFDCLPGFRVVGTTLWSHIPPDLRGAAKTYSNDFAKIEAFDPDTQNTMHARDVAFLREEIRAAADCGEQVIVLTHHAPSEKGPVDPSVSEIERRLDYTPLEDLFEPPGVVKAWLCGHTHFNVDTVVKGTRIVSNQRGYETMGLGTPDFFPGLCIDPLETEDLWNTPWFGRD